jgi:N-acetylneuraminic acid mutarotase
MAKDKWEKMPKMNQERFSASACSLGDNIYVIGGKSFSGASNSIEKLSNPALTKKEAFW